MNLISILHQRARAHPGHVAIHDSVAGVDRHVTFGDLSRRIAAGARFLRDQGLEPGDTVLLLHPLSIELYEVLLSLFHAGMTVMLVDPGNGREFMETCCQRRAPVAFFGSRKAHLLRLAVPGLRRARHHFHAGGWLPFSKKWSTDGASCDPAPCESETPALITFTSGSTGVPKAAVRTHGFLYAQYESLAKSLHLAEGQVDLVTLPVFVLANLAAGVTSVLTEIDLANPSAPRAIQIRQLCERHAVTRCTASPAFFEQRLAHSGALPPFLSLYTGGAPVFLDLLDRLRTALPDANVHAIYGSTEAEPIAEFESRDLSDAERERSRTGGGLPAGRPVDDIDLLILPDKFGQALGPFSSTDFQALALPADQVGEIVVTGNHVLSGYLDGLGDEETKIAVEERIWHRTGDAGCLDPDGNLWLHGRCTARLPGGVYPLAIEAALRDLPGHPRTAAIAHHGTTLVVEAENEDPALTNLIQERVGPLIDDIITLPRIPLDKRHHAKVDYPALRQALNEQPPATHHAKL